LVDREVIRARLDVIAENLEILRREVVPLSREALTTDHNHYLKAERLIQVAIQAVIDICNHLNAALQLHAVRDQRQVIQNLARHGVFPKDFSDTLVQMVGFRNILVHDYCVIDLNRLYEITQNNLDDFDSFARYINEYLEKGAAREN